MRDLAETTAARGSAAFRFTLRSEYPPEFELGPKTTRGSGYVAFDLPAVEARASTYVEEPERGGPRKEIVEAIRMGDDLCTFPVDALEIESSDLVRQYWLKQDAEAAEKAPSGFPYAHFGQSPDLLLRLPTGYVSVPDSSHDRIAGVPVTKFSGEVDFARAGFTPEEFTAVSYLEERVIPVTVWVDEDGVARRISYSLGLKTPLLDNRTGVTAVEHVFDFDGFGETRKVEAPPGDDVITVEEYAAFLEEYGNPVDAPPGLPFDL